MKKRYEAVVVGTSAGGMKALGDLIPGLPPGFPMAVIIVWHVHPQSGHFIIDHLEGKKKLPIGEADEKERAEPGRVYFAPPGYHLLVEHDRTFSLSIDKRVCWSRPSIDVLFESAAEAWRERLIGIILTGANNDGAKGLRKIRDLGGLTMAQDPEEADYDAMPRAAIASGGAELVLPLQGILKRLLSEAPQARESSDTS